MNKVEFLTDDWFSAVERVESDLGDLEVPEGLHKLAWNMVVQMRDGNERSVSMQGMLFRRSHVSSAETTMYLEAELARKWFIEGDATAGIFAFMSGDMRIEGDVTVLTALQTEGPSPRMKLLGEKLKALTLD